MKSILGLVHRDAGTVRVLGQDASGNDVRRHIGYASGGAAFYPRKTLAQITALTKSFYPDWDDAAFAHYLEVFRLDTGKQIRQLSEGMKVKFQLALALVELTDSVRQLAAKGTSILFSTHITTDLLGCADDITYIQAGKIIASKSLPAFLADHPDCDGLESVMVKLEKEEIQL